MQMVQQRLGGFTARQLSLPVLVSINRLQFYDPQVFKNAYQNSASLAGGYPLAQEVKLWDSKLET